MPWIRRVRLDPFEIRVGERVVRIGLSDGIAEYEDADGESYMDGWSTAEDLAGGLERDAKLTPEQAAAVAKEAIRRWRERFGPDHRFDHYRES